jgi:modulator of FtsH protease
MNSLTLAGWENFFVASAGTAAALAGLLFVALSINLSQILKIPGLAARAGETFIPLAVTLVFSLLALVPGRPIRIFAVELTCLGGFVWAASSVIQLRAIRDRHFVRAWHLVLRLSINQPANLTVVLAGLSLTFGFPGGLYWLVPAVLLAFVGAMLNAWILLVEILR